MDKRWIVCEPFCFHGNIRSSILVGDNSALVPKNGPEKPAGKAEIDPDDDQAPTGSKKPQRN